MSSFGITIVFAELGTGSTGFLVSTIFLFCHYFQFLPIFLLLTLYFLICQIDIILLVPLLIIVNKYHFRVIGDCNQTRNYIMATVCVSYHKIQFQIKKNIENYIFQIYQQKSYKNKSTTKSYKTAEPITMNKTTVQE